MQRLHQDDLVGHVLEQGPWQVLSFAAIAEQDDYSVCTTWGALNRQFYLLDVFRQRLNYPDLRRRVEELARRHAATTVLIEDRASGTQLLQDLRGTIYGLRAYAPPPGTDKVMRLHAQTAVFENGFVVLPRVAPWLAAYIDELTSFPGSRYDDQVDSTTPALDHTRASDFLAIWERLVG